MNIIRLFNTLRYLKPVQVLYQAKYRLQKPKPLAGYVKDKTDYSLRRLSFFPLPKREPVLRLQSKGYTFSFLNLEKTFDSTVDWSEQSYGKLWNYNLQYLDFLRQQDIPVAVKTRLLLDLYGWLEAGRLPLEPYPASLRMMNVIRFIQEENVQEPKILKYLFAEANFLTRRLEYHLLGNHLLENGFALLMAGHLFNHPSWIIKAENLLEKELKEQVLSDGAHFELSPMYHQIILFRVLEAVGYLPKASKMGKLCRKTASSMLEWLEAITFSDGSVPHFNDSTDGIAFTTGELKDMAARLGIDKGKEIELSESGYRKLQNQRLALVADVHGISPAYQPGHAHADHLSFVLHTNDSPFIVDQGISTYQIGETRDYERSTRAHNTVTVGEQNTSEVWSGFRVGRRPKVEILESNRDVISGELKYRGLLHRRTFRLADSKLLIEDQVNAEEAAVLRYFFHPSVKITQIAGGKVIFSNGANMIFEGAGSIRQISFLYNKGYHLQVAADSLEVLLNRTCTTEIILDL